MSANSNASPEGTRATSPQSIPDLSHMTSQSNFTSSLLSPNSAAMLLSPTSATTSPTRDKTSKRRTSQNLRVAGTSVMERVGSPNSIPSSPTSVHSSSSAIFERDIEPMLSPSSTSLQSPTSPSATSRHPPDPHRIPRSRNTEQLEQAVPSVLDSAAAILATLDIDSPDGAASSGISVSPPLERNTIEQIAVVAPANSTFESMLGVGGGRNSGFASPLSLRSRSPSPLGSRTRSTHTTDLLLNIPNTSLVSPHTVSSTVSSPTRSPQSRQATLSTSPSGRHAALSTSPSARNASLGTSPPGRTTGLSSSPPSHYAPPMSSSISRDSTLSALSASDTPSLLTPTTEFDPVTSSSFTTASSAFTSPVSPTRNSTLSSHPPSPHTATKRLSFMSYSDLLSSTPASTLPLSSLTKEARGDEPPPHIPSVSGFNLVSAAAASVGGGSSTYSSGKRESRTPSVRGFSLSSSPSPPAGLAASLAAAASGGNLHTLNHAHSQGGLTHAANKRDSIALVDNVGGEWEREGLGMGLEERLEAVVGRVDA